MNECAHRLQPYWVFAVLLVTLYYNRFGLFWYYILRLICTLLIRLVVINHHVNFSSQWAVNDKDRKILSGKKMNIFYSKFWMVYNRPSGYDHKKRKITISFKSHNLIRSILFSKNIYPIRAPISQKCSRLEIQDFWMQKSEKNPSNIVRY